MLKEFRDFVLRGNVVELAVAVVIGAAFGAVVTAFVSSFVTPLIAALGGKPDFSALLSFLIIAAVVFFFVVRPLNALMARLRPEPAVDHVVRQCPECLSDIPQEARRCAFCTAEVRPA